MDRENSAPRGDWKGERENRDDRRAERGAWKGEKPTHPNEQDENKRLRRDLGQSPDGRA